MRLFIFVMLPYKALSYLKNTRHFRISPPVIFHSLETFLSSSTSDRIQETDPPIVTHTRQLMSLNTSALSLAQGVVNWSPPESAIERLINELGKNDKYAHSYCHNLGLVELRNLIKVKLRSNGILNSEIMVTSGANQAFTNVVLALVDPTDAVVAFKPYYFNHIMAIQMTGNSKSLVIGEVDNELHPDPNWLEEQLETNKAIKMVVVCNPCNPTGIVYPKDKLLRIQKACQAANVWLIIDNTYEEFTYEEDKPHISIEGDNIINIYSFSKAYGMMGWRLGYLAYPNRISKDLIKVQDNIAICPAVVSQILAIGAMESDPQWLQDKVTSLQENKMLLLNSIEVIRTGGHDGVIFGGSGAIYLWFKLPSVVLDHPTIRTKLQATAEISDAIAAGSIPSPPSLDQAISDWLGLVHGVILIPGSSCGMPGYLRVCYANLPYDLVSTASDRLRWGLTQLIELCSN